MTSLEELFAMLFQGLDMPWWLLLILASTSGVASIMFGGRLPVWAGPVLVALRTGAFAAMKWPKLRIPGYHGPRDPDPVEEPPAPPMDLPEGGMPVPGKEWQDGEP